MIFIEYLGQLDQIVASVTGNDRLELSGQELIHPKGKLKLKLLHLGKTDDFVILKGVTDHPIVTERIETVFGPKIFCKLCENELFSIPVIKRIVNLPSTYYKELMECFTCHDQRIDTKFEVKGALDQILRTPTFAIFSIENMVPDSLKLKDLVRCSRCYTLMGEYLEGSIKLYLDHLLGITPLMTFVDRFVQDLLELVNHHATYRFIVNQVLLLRVINWNAKVYDSVVCEGIEFKEAIKVLYVVNDSETLSKWKSDGQVDRLVYLEQELVELLLHLKQSNINLAPPYKTMEGFNVGFL